MSIITTRVRRKSARVRVKFRGARNSIIVPPGYTPLQRGADVKFRNSELHKHTHIHTYIQLVECLWIIAICLCVCVSVTYKGEGCSAREKLERYFDDFRQHCFVCAERYILYNTNTNATNATILLLLLLYTRWTLAIAAYVSTTLNNLPLPRVSVCVYIYIYAASTTRPGIDLWPPPNSRS